MHKTLGVLFAITCFATAGVSASLMGAGMWFWIIIASGTFVAVSQFYPVIRGAGSGLAVLLGIVSICAVALGLLASTIGGSFRLDDQLAILLLLFFVIFILGLVLGSMFKRSLKRIDER